MIKAKDINSQRFEKAAFGYKQEDVDTFLAEIAADYAQLVKENEDISAKLQVLADKVREYRKDEEAVKDALLFAQKEGHRVVTEASEKADEMLRNAKLESDRMVNEATSDTRKAVDDVRDELKREQKNLTYLQKQVSAFKKNLFDVYKSHLEMISSLPQSDEEEDEEYTEEAEEQTIPSPRIGLEKPAAAVTETVRETAKEAAEEKPEEKQEEKVDPFRTQSIPIIGGGDSKYAELQFGQQNTTN